MGKFCIKILILGIIMSIAGTVILAVEALNGFIDEIPSLPIDSHNHAVSGEYAVTTMLETSDVVDQVTYTFHDVYETARKANVSPEEIQELDISISMGSFDIIPGDSFMLYANGIDENYLEFAVNDGCLDVKYSPDINLFDLEWLSASPDIMLYVPIKTYDKVNIDMSAGTLSVSEISAQDFVLDISAGNAYLTAINAFNSSDIKMSAGDAVFSHCIFENSNNINMSMGSMIFEECSITGQSDIKVSAGDLQMYLSGSSEYYDISANKSAGSLYINDKEVNTYNVDSASDNPNGTINVKVSAGSCYIVFDED